MGVALAAAGSALASSWVPVKKHDRQGAISASLVYEKNLDPGAFPRVRNIRLTVFRAGKAVFAEPICLKGSCEPASPGPLDVRTVWGDPHAEVVVELYTGSAHCCFKTEIAFEARGAWRSITHNWGNLGYRGQWHDGTYWFVTGDDKFAYAFTDYADSAFPMQVWTIDPAGRFVNVTRKRLDLVAGNATQLWAAYLKDRATKGTDVRGVLGAWCADQYLLGKRAACEAELRSALKKGLLHIGVHDGTFGPRDAAYIKELKRDLAAWGYAR